MTPRAGGTPTARRPEGAYSHVPAAALPPPVARRPELSSSLSEPLLYHRLTTPGFRQRADRERTFTASAPPGMRPPPRRSEPDDATDNFVDRDLDRDLGREAEAEMEMSRGQPRRDAVFTPCPRRHSTA